jgi:carbonic anhydrase/acetyltransferase-like protein (isoleucine patch superfamily)
MCVPCSILSNGNNNNNNNIGVYNMTDNIDNNKTFMHAFPTGPALAKRHVNGGGIVALTAKVSESAHVGSGAMVFENATVLGSAVVGYSARVYGNATVSGNSYIRDEAKVYGYAMVGGSAVVYNKAKVYGSAVVRENARVHGKARVYGKAMLQGWATVRDSAKVYGSAVISGNSVVSYKAIVCGSVELENIKVGGKALVRGDKSIVHGVMRGYKFVGYLHQDGTQWLKFGCEDLSLEEWRINHRALARKHRVRGGDILTRAACELTYAVVIPKSNKRALAKSVSDTCLSVL